MKPYYRSNLLCALTWCLAVVVILFAACNEDEKEIETIKKGKVPEVITYSPEYTEAGSETDAMIMGENFGTESSNVTVKLGEMSIAVKEVGNSVIKFKIPNTLEVGTYPLSVEIAYTDKEDIRQTVSHTFEVDFEVRGNVPVVSGYLPSTGTYAGGEVTIEGDYFGTDKNNVTVTLDGTKLAVTTLTTTTITFTVPEDSEIGSHELKIEIKYGVNAAKTFHKTFSDFQVVTKEYVATSSVYAGTGENGIANGPRLTATFLAPYSLAYDASAKSLYVGEALNGIRLITNDGEVSSYKSPAEGNPWAFNTSCAVCVSGDQLYYTIKEAHDRQCDILYMATRSGGTFGEATGYQTPASPYTDVRDVAVNPVDGRIILTRYSWDSFRMESYFYLLNAVDATPVDLSSIIPPLWVNNSARLLFSPDGKWLYVSRSSDNATVPSGEGADRPHAYIVRYPYNSDTHTLGSEKEVVAGSEDLNKIGFVDGVAGTSQLNGPRQMYFDSTGETLYFVDQHNHALRKVTDLDGTKTTSTLAGTGSSGSNNVTEAPISDLRNVQFNNPVGLALADDNTFYIGEDGGKVIRKIEIKLKSNN